MTHIHTQACQELKEQLSGFIDGDLEDAVCQEIQRHMEDCDDCRIMVDTLKKTIVLYRASPEEAVPPDVHARLFKVLDLQAMQKGTNE